MATALCCRPVLMVACRDAGFEPCVALEIDDARAGQALVAEAVPKEIRSFRADLAPMVVALSTEDRQRSFNFYTEGLGLEPIGEAAEDGIPEPLQFVLNQGVRLMLVVAFRRGWRANCMRWPERNGGAFGSRVRSSVVRTAAAQPARAT